MSHLPTAKRFAELPFLEALSDYPAAPFPLFYMLLGGAAGPRRVGAGPAGRQRRHRPGLLWLVYVQARTNRGFPAVAAAALVVAVLISPYFRGTTVYANTDPLPLALLVGGLRARRPPARAAACPRPGSGLRRRLGPAVLRVRAHRAVPARGVWRPGARVSCASPPSARRWRCRWWRWCSIGAARPRPASPGMPRRGGRAGDDGAGAPLHLRPVRAALGGGDAPLPSARVPRRGAAARLPGFPGLPRRHRASRSASDRRIGGDRRRWRGVGRAGALRRPRRGPRRHPRRGLSSAWAATWRISCCRRRAPTRSCC